MESGDNSYLRVKRKGLLMNLRTSFILKIFAILLFSLELFAPAFLSEATSLDINSRHLIKNQYSQSILFLILESKSSESEENLEDQQNAIVVPSFLEQSFLLNLTTSEPIRSRSTASQQFDTSPPLFRLHCTYLI